MPSVATALEFANDDPDPIQLIVEPWAIECELPPNQTAKVVFFASDQQAVRCQLKKGRVTIEGWEGSTVEVWCGETQIF